MSKKNLFETRIWHQALASSATTKRLNRDLIKDIQALEELDIDGRKWSSKNFFGGYTSYGSMDNLHLRFAPFMKLKELIDRFARQYFQSLDCLGRLPNMQTCWVNVMPAGCAHSLHLHPMSVISGTYYVETPRGSGRLKFEDPRLTAMMAAPPKTPFQFVEPRAGDLVLFPSWLRHEVEPSRSKHPRISVSFNY